MADILCVDDTPEILRIYQRVLRRNNLTLAHDGLEGVEAYRSRYEGQQGTFDLVITDMTMPDASGLYLIGEVKRMNPDQRIILIAECSPELVQQARDLGASDHLGKPFTPQDLTAMVSKYL